MRTAFRFFGGLALVVGLTAAPMFSLHAWARIRSANAPLPPVPSGHALVIAYVAGVALALIVLGTMLVEAGRPPWGALLVLMPIVGPLFALDIVARWASAAGRPSQAPTAAPG